MWTKESIRRLLTTNDRAVERGVVAIYNRQTADEKRDRDTKHKNHVGFRANHASTMSKFARTVLMGWEMDRIQRHSAQVHLKCNELARARDIILHYCQQLADIANAPKQTHDVQH